MYNYTQLMQQPVNAAFKIFTDLLGWGFFLIPISFIGLALWQQSKDAYLVSMYFTTTFAIFSGASIMSGMPGISPLYIMLTALGVAALILEFIYGKKT